MLLTLNVPNLQPRSARDRHAQRLADRFEHRRRTASHWCSFATCFRPRKALVSGSKHACGPTGGIARIVEARALTKPATTTCLRPVPTARRSAISRLFMPSSRWPRGGAPRYSVGRAVAESDYHELPSAREARRAEFRLPVAANRKPGQCAPQQRLYFRPEPHGQGSLRPYLAAECRRIVMDRWGMEPGAAPAALPDLPGLGPDVQIAHELWDHSGRKPFKLVLGLLPSTPSGRNRNRSAQRSC